MNPFSKRGVGLSGKIALVCGTLPSATRNGRDVCGNAASIGI
jgi:hypothetical protein